MFLKEKEIVTEDFLSRIDVYNIVPGGLGGDKFSTHPDKEIIREKCRNRPNGMSGKKHSEKSIKLMQKNKKGQRKGISTWNKGLVMPEEYKQRQICSENFSGVKNPKAKKYLCISPSGIEHFVLANFINFCTTHQLPHGSFLWYVNKGIIPIGKGRCGPLRKNLTGWNIIDITLIDT